MSPTGTTVEVGTALFRQSVVFSWWGTLWSVLDERKAHGLKEGLNEAFFLGSPGSSAGKESAFKAGDLSPIPRS